MTTSVPAAPGGLVLRQLEDGVDRLLLGPVDEGAGVDDEDVGLGGVVGRQLMAGAWARPSITSESTRFLGQPSETRPIFIRRGPWQGPNRAL